MKWYGHTAPAGKNQEVSLWQLLKTHLENVASNASDYARPLGMEAEAHLAGLLHDLGKYAERFQARLRSPALIYGVNHWAAGTYAAIEAKMWPVAFAVDGHHRGIPALKGDKSLRQTKLHFSEPKERQKFTSCPESLAELLARLREDGLVLPTALPSPVTDRFAEALRTRFLFSCLVDADFLDTEAHFTPETPSSRIAPTLNAEDALAILQSDLDKKSADGSVNALRRQLLNDCLLAAEKSPGLFNLTAPTGSGKTLASLAFALRHIAFQNAALPLEDPRRFRRIIVVIPYTSIIEQTARVFRDLFEAAFGPDYVLEHHSAVAPRERSEDGGRDAEDARMWRARLAAENWASPLVVTTSVQFFESLFSNRPSTCRKLHNIGRSVVLFDEVQTLPPRLLPSLLSAVRLLSQEPYGVTAVFMTATQPAFDRIAPKALPRDYQWNPREISSDKEAMAETLRRTRIQLPAPQEDIGWPELAAQLSAQPQALCVVNTTKDARELFRRLPPAHRFHLSARMCPAHRLQMLAEIRRRLAPSVNQPCVLISTQLIEAGVDLDFPIAFRALGPLDSIIQTAGRCNREGRHALPCPVVIFRPRDGGHLPKEYEQVMKITEAFLHGADAAALHLPETYALYFEQLYSIKGPEKAEADKVFEFSRQLDFPAAADACQLIPKGTRSVLVKWEGGEGARLAEKLEREKHLTAQECRLAQRYSISLYEGEFRAGLSQGWIVQPCPAWDFWVWNSHYDQELGACHAKATDFNC